MEWSLVPDGSGTGCNCSCSASGGGSDCSCDCDGGPAVSGTETYQQIRIEAWRNTGVAGTTNNLAFMRYLGPAGPTNCSSTNPSDGDDNRAILNCDFDSPTVAIVLDGTPADRIALYERYDGSITQIYYNRFTAGAWGGSTVLPGSADPSHAPKIVMDNTGDALAVWVEYNNPQWRIDSSSFSPGGGGG